MGNPAGYVPETLISDGVTTRLPFSYQAYDTATIKLKVIDQTTGEYTDKTVTSVETSYGVIGGFVNIATAATAGDTYVIYDDAPYSQDLNIQATGDLRNDMWVRAIDKLSRQIQIVADNVRRSLKFAIGETTVDGTFEGTAVAGRALVINDTADGIKISDTSIDDIDAALATAEAQAAAAAASAVSAGGSAGAAAASEGAALDYEALCAQAVVDAEAAAQQAIAAAGTGLPVGAMMQWGTSTPPSGFLTCDGSAVSRTGYAALFAVIGTQFGAGDGSTTFTLPNIKGKVVVGLDASQTEFDAIGETGGAKSVTLTAAQSGTTEHTHTMGKGSYVSGSDGFAFALGGTDATTNSSASANASEAHTNLQPYIVLPFIIKADGNLTPDAVVSTDGTFAANSDALVPTQKAIKAYVAANKGETYVALSGETLSISWSQNACVDVDVSSKVPVGAKRVHLGVDLLDTITGANVAFRKNGSSFNTFVAATQAANATFFSSGQVELDTNRIFEAFTNSESMTTRVVRLLGYWI